MSASDPAAFISYSRNDSEFVMRLAGDLKAAGANVWLDQLDISPGQRWDRAVEGALDDSPVMLVVLSSAAIDSMNVMDEVSFALGKQKTVIPILIQDCAIPFRLRRIQHIDFRRDYTRGLGVLLKHLGVQVAEPVAPQASEASTAMLPATGAEAELQEQLRQERESDRKAREEEEAQRKATAEREAREEAKRKAQAEEEARLKATAEREELEEVRSILAIPPIKNPTEERPTHDARANCDVGEQKQILRTDLVGGGPESRYYITQPAAAELQAALEKMVGIVLVKGSRQVGKTSLMVRGLLQARKTGKTVVFLDLQKLNNDELKNLTTLYKALGGMVADQLKIDTEIEDTWKERKAPSVNFENYIRREVMDKMEGHLVIGMDEADRLLRHDYASEVFSMFRSWHNAHAFNPDLPWNRITVVLVTAGDRVC
jgi:hypothetical protein